MILRLPVHHLEVELLLPKIALVAENNIEADLSQRKDRFAWHDAMEGCVRRLEDGEWDAHLPQCLGEDDVDAAASIHEYA